MALLPVFFLEGLSGAFFQPLALSYALAVLASMVVALTVTPALALILLRKAPLERRESPLVRVAAARLRARALARIIRRPRPAYVAVGAVMRRRRSRSCPLLGQSLLPDFKERDFLMHWLTKPGTSRRGGGADHRRRPARSCATIPGVRNFGSHIGQALPGDEVVGVNFGENWISIDPDGRLRRDAGRDPGGRSTAIPGCSATCRPTSTRGSTRC